MKIIKLTVSNVKRIRVVEITPDGKSIIIGGKNGAGKTSLIDAIAATLGGKKLCPKVPIRKGEDKGESRVETEDLVVTRTWTKDESHVVVSNKDGSIHRSPQKILDDLVGRMTFDPLEFSRQDPSSQLATIQELVGLDFTELDGKRDGVYGKRRDVNRDMKAAEARLVQMEQHEDAPTEEVSVSGLVEELERRSAHNEKNAAVRQQHANAQSKVAAENNSVADHKEVVVAEARAVVAAQQELDHARERLEDANRSADEARSAEAIAAKTVAKLKPADEDEVRAQIAGAEGINRKHRDNAARAKQAEQTEALQQRSKELTAEIATIDAKKQETTSAAKYPIEGLAVGDEGVMFNGLPLEQASSAELLRISAAMGFALNPTLRVLLIRDGSLLDEDSLALLLSMAQEADTQLWIERVGEGGASVVIEDGAVKG